MANKRVLTIKQQSLFGDPKILFERVIERFPQIHLLSQQHELTKDEIRKCLIINKQYELSKFKIKQQYSKEDQELTAKNLNENKISMKRIVNNEFYLKEYAKISLNSAQPFPGQKPFLVMCGDIKIGIITLSVPLMSTIYRNKILPKELDKQDGINIQLCVSYPWAGKYITGKLLATLACTYALKHNYDYVETTSLFGKSIQYDRLPFLRYLGLTAGEAGYKYIFPRIFFEKIYDLLNKYYDVKARQYHDKFKPILRDFLKISNLWDKGYRTNSLLIKRGYYFCTLNKKIDKTYKQERLPPKSYEEAIEYWRKRWLVKRL